MSVVRCTLALILIIDNRDITSSHQLQHTLSQRCRIPRAPSCSLTRTGALAASASMLVRTVCSSTHNLLALEIEFGLRGNSCFLVLFAV